jgi:hypothetical protein
MNLFENVINEEVIETLTPEEAKLLLEILTKAGY